MKVYRKQPPATIPLCSTADVAFLLLIFFIVLAKGARESSIDWKPAKTQSQLVNLSSSNVTVIIDRDNRCFVNGNETPISTIKDVVNEFIKDKPKGQRQVLLKIHKEVKADIFQPLMFDLGEIGADMFRILDPTDKKDKK